MPVTYRTGTLDDSHDVFQIFISAIMDYSQRMNVMAITGGNDPEIIASIWTRRQPLFEFLANHAAQFWVAEKDGEIIAYARSIEQDGMQELTEFFVSPQHQSTGVGAELLSRAFPQTGARYRTIIATLDERALYRYLKAGVYGRFPIKYFSRKAEQVDVPTDLRIEPMQIDTQLEDLNRIDREIISHVRPDLHRWVISDREGFVYKRGREIVGYGYVSPSSGPFAVLDEKDFPAVLAHAESLMAEQGKEFGAEAPLINENAVQYFIERKYQIDSFSTIFMSNVSFGKFEKYLYFTPEFFM